jgi:N-methylhydantoinase B/oxoprolinase/acetone carboxylase alpha subunit
MSTKMLDATCSAVGIVTAEGSLVQDAEILSQGKQASSGVLLIEQDKARYLTSNASDIKALITSLVAIINQIATIATGIDAASNSPGGQTAAITQLQTLKTQLDATKDLLK